MMQPAHKAETTLRLPVQIGGVKRMLEGVLAEFEITYKWIKETSHILSVEIWVFNKHLIYTYTHIEHRVGDCRAELRNKLMLLKAPRKTQHRAISGTSDLTGVPLSVTVAMEKTRRGNLLTSAAMIGAIPKQKIVFDPKPEVKMVQNAPDPIEESVEATDQAAPSRTVYPDPAPESLDSRALYHSTLLAPAEVMVIDILSDLIVPQGEVLVIPMHDPSLHLHMPKSQFQGLFRQIERSPPVPEVPAAVSEPQALEPPAPTCSFCGRPRDEVKQLYAGQSTQVNICNDCVVKCVATAEPAQAVEAVQAPVPVVQVPPPPLAPPQPQTPPSGVPQVIESPIDLELRSVDGISSQIARHMAAIAHMQLRGPRKAVTVRQLIGLLDERDQKQVSARMPVACRLGFANRHAKSGEVLQYSITPSGLALLARMKTWPWLREGMAVPEWATSL
jgi:hypothetical protein